MTIHPTLGLCCLALLAASLPATDASASEPGNMMKMHVTSRMQVPGVPFQMPPITHNQEVCVSAKKPDPRDMTKQNKDCKVTDYKESGNTVSYRMACTGDVQMNGEGSYEMLDGGGVRGTLHFTGSSRGESVTMDMNYEGERIGSCDYTPPQAP